MTMQPPAVLFADAVGWACAYLAPALVARGESGVRVSALRGTSEREVVIRRDGGRSDGVFDAARLTVRVFALTEHEATRLASVVRALLLVAPRTDSVAVRVVSLSGPNAVPDLAGPQVLMSFDVTLRGADL